jgi:ABC-type phosphate transport system permease subunit
VTSPVQPKPLEVRGTAMRRRVGNAAFTVACYAATVIVIVPLAFIVWHLVAKGAQAYRSHSSRTCRSRSASRAAAWRTRSSAPPSSR